MALQPRCRIHQAYAQIRRHPVSTSKQDHLVLSNIYSNHKKLYEVRIKILTVRNKNCDLQVPMTIMKQCTDSCVTLLTDLINSIVNDQNWPVGLGSANITPAHKKLSTTDKGNYRAISVLPSISKIFKKHIYEQLSDFMEDKLSPFLSGLRKQHSAQHALIRMIEKWKHRILRMTGEVKPQRLKQTNKYFFLLQATEYL